MTKSRKKAPEIHYAADQSATVTPTVRKKKRKTILQKRIDKKTKPAEFESGEMVKGRYVSSRHQEKHRVK